MNLNASRTDNKRWTPPVSRAWGRDGSIAATKPWFTQNRYTCTKKKIEQQRQVSLLVESIERCVWYISRGHFERKVKSLIYSWDNSRAHKLQLHGVILNVKIWTYFYSAVNITPLFLHITPFMKSLALKTADVGSKSSWKTPDVSQKPVKVPRRICQGTDVAHVWDSAVSLREREQVPAKVVQECTGKNCTSAPRCFRPLYFSFQLAL